MEIYSQLNSGSRRVRFQWLQIGPGGAGESTVRFWPEAGELAGSLPITRPHRQPKVANSEAFSIDSPPRVDVGRYGSGRWKRPGNGRACSPWASIRPQAQAVFRGGSGVLGAMHPRGDVTRGPALIRLNPLRALYLHKDAPAVERPDGQEADGGK